MTDYDPARLPEGSRNALGGFQTLPPDDRPPAPFNLRVSALSPGYQAAVRRAVDDGLLDGFIRAGELWIERAELEGYDHYAADHDDPDGGCYIPPEASLAKVRPRPKPGDPAFWDQPFKPADDGSPVIPPNFAPSAGFAVPLGAEGDEKLSSQTPYRRDFPGGDDD